MLARGHGRSRTHPALHAPGGILDARGHALGAFAGALQHAGRHADGVERIAQVGVNHFPRAAGENTGASFGKILRTFRDIGKLRLALWLNRDRVLGERAATAGESA